MFKLLRVILILILPFGCRVVRIDELDPEKKTLIPIRTDGYYYTTYVRPPYHDAAGRDIPETNFIEPVFLFQDNSCYVSGGYESHNAIYDRLPKEGYKQMLRNQYGWGYFCIEGDEITIQTTLIRTSGFVSATIGVVELKGKILNDTTFAIGTLLKAEDGTRSIGSDVYRFKANGPKPDSSNWVKDYFEKKKSK